MPSHNDYNVKDDYKKKNHIILVLLKGEACIRRHEVKFFNYHEPKFRVADSPQNNKSQNHSHKLFLPYSPSLS